MTTPSAPPRFTPGQIRRRRAIALRVSVALLVTIGLLFVVVFPVSAWIDQRASLDQSEHRLEVLKRERLRLDRVAALLTLPSEIQRIARERYGMVKPGEQAYAVVRSAPTSTTTTPLPSAP